MSGGLDSIIDVDLFPLRIRVLVSTGLHSVDEANKPRGGTVENRLLAMLENVRT